MAATFFLLLAFLWVQCVRIQSSAISFSVDTEDGLVYFLLILFFALYYATPVVRYVYVNYLTELVDRAGQQVAKAQKRLTEKLSDAGRKVSQSVRSV
jgi:hypothetical protein